MKIIIGQIFGWLATFFSIISFQCKTRKQLIWVQTVAACAICMSYLLLGAYSGMFMNIVCVVRNIIYSLKEKKLFSYRFWPYLLSVIVGIVGIASWQGPISLLIIIALMINTVFLSFENVQYLRMSILLTSTLVMIYDIYFHIWGGVANECLAIISSVVGLIRFRKIKT